MRAIAPSCSRRACLYCLSPTTYHAERWGVCPPAVDGDAVGGNVTGPDIPCYRAKPRTLLLSKKMETVFYVCICLSAVNSGIQTYPEYEKTEPVVMLGWFTNIMVSRRGISLPSCSSCCSASSLSGEQRVLTKTTGALSCDSAVCVRVRPEAGCRQWVLRFTLRFFCRRVEHV